MGGIGQERLLAASVALLAEVDDLSPMLEYLGGAGVGRIYLECFAEADALATIRAEMAQLNPDVRIEQAAQAQRCDLLMVIAGSNRVIEAARQANRRGNFNRVILARLGEPFLLSMQSSRPPCLACANPAILAPIQRGASAVPIAALAAAEALRLLIANAPPAWRMIEFNGWQARSTPGASAAGPGCPVCLAPACRL